MPLVRVTCRGTLNSYGMVAGAGVFDCTFQLRVSEALGERRNAVIRAVAQELFARRWPMPGPEDEDQAFPILTGVEIEEVGADDSETEARGEYEIEADGTYHRV
ncbi:MAG: hypothetical protein U0835_04330 [Isosphaeraceae bacterium]